MNNNSLHQRIKNIKSKIFRKRGLRFIISGATATLTDICVYFLTFNFLFCKKDISLSTFTIKAHSAALCISFTSGFIANFFMSSRFVFHESELAKNKQFFRYILTSAINFLCNYILLKLFVDAWGFFPTPSRALSAIIVAFISFAMNKYYAFSIK